MQILITGGLGYIGSHVVASLIEKGYDVIVFDNLSNSSIDVLQSLKAITGNEISFFEGDILKTKDLDDVFRAYNFDAVIHLAALKAVGESTKVPLKYFDCNLVGTVNLLKAMEKEKVFKLLFSSSATVYGSQDKFPLKEENTTIPQNPYGMSKYLVELLLESIAQNNKDWSILSLRYFNPGGSHDSYLIGENPTGIPNNLLPFLNKVAFGEIEKLSIFGCDYDTPDGTALRDYIHVTDLANAHINALDYIYKNHSISYDNINLGSGRGVSVLELVNNYSNTNNINIPFSYIDRRQGDVAITYSCIEKANKLLRWKPQRSLEDISMSSFNFFRLQKTKNKRP